MVPVVAISFGHFFGHFNFPIFWKKVIQVANPNRAQFTKCASYAIPSTTETCWLAEWGYSAIFSSFSSASAGVCILFNNNFVFKILRQFFDPAGRFIIADIETEDRVLTLANIYAPNQDNPIFFLRCC